MINKVKQLEDYVDEVSYSHSENYIPTKEALEVVNFIKAVNGAKGEENKTPVMHLKMLDGLIHQNDNLFVVHRGGAKTSVIHEYVFLFIAVYGKFFSYGEQSVAIYVSDTMDNGVKSMRDQLEFRWQESEFLQYYLPYAKFTDERWEFENRKGKRFFIRGFAAMTGVRGFKKYGKRPTWAGFDDLLSDKNSKSPTILADIENVIYNAATEALHPTKRKICWTGTPFSQKDSLYKAVGSGAWNVMVFPLCESFPCDKEDYRGSWEDRFTYESTKNNYYKKLKNGKIASFNQELMLRIVNDDDRLVLKNDIKWFNLKNLMDNRENFNFYITTDFATSIKDSSDFSVILVWAYSSGGQLFLVDGICERRTMDKNINDLFRLAQEYKPQSVGVEVSGQQGGFISWIKTEMLNRNIWFTLASEGNRGQEGIRPVTNKMARFNIILPWIKQGLIHLPIELKSTTMIAETLNELYMATSSGFKSLHDDVIDAISMLALLKMWKPSEEVIIHKNPKNGIWSMDEDDIDNGIKNSYLE